MKKRRISKILLIMLIATTLGAGIIKADPVCRRLVREYREKRVKNRVSKETADRWAEWNKTHPNFHPHARPKYKTVPEEVVKQVDFACQVPISSTQISTLLPPAIPDFKFEPETPPVLPPPELPPVTQIAGNPPPPFLPPYNGGLPPGLSSVPEPSSFVFLFSGCLFLATGAYYQKRRQPKPSR